MRGGHGIVTVRMPIDSLLESVSVSMSTAWEKQMGMAKNSLASENGRRCMQ